MDTFRPPPMIRIDAGVLIITCRFIDVETLPLHASCWTSLGTVDPYVISQLVKSVANRRLGDLHSIQGRYFMRLAQVSILRTYPVYASTPIPISSIRTMSSKSKRGGKNDAPPAPIPGNSYCLSCGRLMPSGNCTAPLASRNIANTLANQTENTTPRKYCSASCKSRAKDPSLKDYHLQLSKAFHTRLTSNPDRHVAICSEVETEVPIPEGKQDAREEARRAARRLVNFGFRSQGIEEDREVEAVQDGKVVETSFAKGEWGIRWVRG